jgi:hypothetical protein
LLIRGDEVVLDQVLVRNLHDLGLGDFIDEALVLLQLLTADHLE